jgi:hypothetical protein
MSNLKPVDRYPLIVSSGCGMSVCVKLSVLVPMHKNNLERQPSNQLERSVTYWFKV